jgi:hypothetical protein
MPYIQIFFSKMHCQIYVRYWMHCQNFEIFLHFCLKGMHMSEGMCQVFSISDENLNIRSLQCYEVPLPFFF